MIGAGPGGAPVVATGNHLTDVQAWFKYGKGRRLRDQMEAMGAPAHTDAEADALVRSWFDRLQVKTQGDPEMLDLVATGAHAGESLIAKPGKINDKILDWLDMRTAQGPQKVKGDLVLSVSGSAASKTTQRLDRAVESLFSLLMAQP